MGTRPYDPNTGRFLSNDPVPGGSLNNYDYAGQDPINNYDLGGTTIQSDDSGIELGVGAPVTDTEATAEDPRGGSPATQGPLTESQDLTYEKVVRDPDKMRHIFANPTHDHQLDSLVERFGSPDAVVREVVMQLNLDTSEENAIGVFKVERVIDGETVEIQGRVFDGTTRISDFWVPTR